MVIITMLSNRFTIMLYFLVSLSLLLINFKDINNKINLMENNFFLGCVQCIGFDIESLQKACCGAGGDYGFTLMKGCGDPDVPVCPNPDKRIIWDGVHLTQQAYKYISDWLIRDIYPNLHC